MDTVQSQFIELRGETFHFLRKSTKGPVTLLFVHGNSSSAASFLPLLGYLSSLSWVAVDQRGFGKSSLNSRAKTLAQFSADLSALILALSLENVILVGWSFGGGVVLKLMSVEGEASRRIKGAVLLGSVGQNAYPLLNQNNMRLTEDADIKSHPKVLYMESVYDLKDEAALASIFKRLMHNGREEAALQLARNAIEQRNYSDVVTALSAQTRIKVQAVSVPVLFVHGKYDILLKSEGILKTVQKIKGARLVELDCGHMLPVQKSQEVGQLISNFVTGLAHPQTQTKP